MKFVPVCLLFMLSASIAHAQSPSFDTYVNPVIPGDHPDPTLTRIGDYFYTTGSSFNPTPKIWRSTDLIHWEVISQPVSAAWTQYGDAPAGGAWGGHIVYHNGEYWHYFGLGANMWYVKADQPEGPWSDPVSLRVPSGVPGLGRDNSIFIDDDGRWYLLVKNGQSVNYIVELDETGQPNGEVFNLSWLNPAPDLPYGWAEGPVMWKREGRYYYSFAQHLAGVQYVMWSDTLSDDPQHWSQPRQLFESVADRGSRFFRDPNHNSPAVVDNEGRWWSVSHAYRNGIGSEWMSHGRQGLLTEIVYDEEGVPTALFPANGPMNAPNLPSGGVGWSVPKSDMFDEPTLDPEWSFLGYTPTTRWSLTERPGWLRLRPQGNQNTVIKNDGELSWSIITRVDFAPEMASHEAGLWVFNGLETIQAKLFSSVNEAGNPIIVFTYETNYQVVPNTAGNVVWLKLERFNHRMTGYFSANGRDWTQVGDP
ncbi:MAG TPA: family 43 glycosylhydrolase, partial [Rhodothermales bacterium]